jgi:hypothetical protein
MKKALERVVSQLLGKQAAVAVKVAKPASGIAAETHIRAGKFVTNNVGNGFVPFDRWVSFLDAQVRRAGRVAALLSGR